MDGFKPLIWGSILATLGTTLFLLYHFGIIQFYWMLGTTINIFGFPLYIGAALTSPILSYGLFGGMMLAGAVGLVWAAVNGIMYLVNHCQSNRGGGYSSPSYDDRQRHPIDGRHSNANLYANGVVNTEELPDAGNADDPVAHGRRDILNAHSGDAASDNPVTTIPSHNHERNQDGTLTPAPVPG